MKEDLIIPHQHNFYELIVNKARGKSGPLFHFDVHEDVRTIADATIEKDESHAGKVVVRHSYEKNKHIFPVLQDGRSSVIPTRFDPFRPLYLLCNPSQIEIKCKSRNALLGWVMIRHVKS